MKQQFMYKYDRPIFAVIDNIASSVPTTQNRLTLYKNSSMMNFIK